GMPLAIELAAARVNVLSVEQIRKRLSDHLRLLGSGRDYPSSRHETLRATFEWSYDLLSAEEQAIFRALSVFVGGWTLASARAIYPRNNEFEILDLLSRLADKSLVSVCRVDEEESRYLFLETLRDYAYEKLLESGEECPVRNRHLDYYLTFAEDVAPELWG